MIRVPSTSVLTAATARIDAGQSLSAEQAGEAFAVIMAGLATSDEIAAFLMGLRAKGETAEEVAGVAGALRLAMLPVALGNRGQLVDTCGTGGGRITTLNISTAAALVAAGAGVPIAKHGNRSFTSRSGSADVLESLGVAVDLGSEEAPAVFDAAGIVFLFAQIYHPAMRHAAPVRRQLGVATVLNLVGPLANPAGAPRQVLGVADAGRGRLMADALARLGASHAMVVHAESGLDEISPVGMSRVWRVLNGSVTEERLDPADHGLATGNLAGTEGGEPAENAAALMALLRAPQSAPEALRAAVLLNAAAAIEVSGDGPSFGDAVARAQRSLDEGAALERLERLRAAAPLRTS